VLALRPDDGVGRDDQDADASLGEDNSSELLSFSKSIEPGISISIEPPRLV
jgi:hypothetical protein